MNYSSTVTVTGTPNPESVRLLLEAVFQFLVERNEDSFEAPGRVTGEIYVDISITQKENA